MQNCEHQAKLQMEHIPVANALIHMADFSLMVWHVTQRQEVTEDRKLSLNVKV